MKETVMWLIIAVARVIKGITTFIPGVLWTYTKLYKHIHPGTVSARYCYSVWLRHLVMAHKAGLPTNPKTVAELGPGNSIGIGLTALLCGAENYFGFDIVEYATTHHNLKVFDDLVDLLRRQEPIPGNEEFPKAKPYLDDYNFPSDILTHDRCSEALHPERIDRIRTAISQPDNGTIIRYIVPWNDKSLILTESVDMIFSQAVLEHIDNLETTYDTLYTWLKPGGIMSHQIDFRSHGTAWKWNGHWAYSDFVWKLIVGRQPYLINRMSRSVHLKLIKKALFKINYEKEVENNTGVPRLNVQRKFRSLPEKDFKCQGTYILASKR